MNKGVKVGLQAELRQLEEGSPEEELVECLEWLEP